MKQIIECIPNFSEGANSDTIQAIAEAIQGVHGVQLLHQDSGAAANRTVFTFVGGRKSVFEAAFQAIKKASELIDMRKQQGEHPRIGACDVCPFVPISGIEMQELIPLVHAFAKRVAEELSIPIYLYEESATSTQRKNLARHRIGEYEGLQSRIERKKWLPDFGNYRAETGGTVMGARNFLVAYNINLNTKDASIANEIACDLREKGRPIRKANSQTVYQAGLLSKVKAIGWYIEDFDMAQVSINLTDFHTTSLFEVYETTKQLAEKYRVQVTGSELIGLIPLAALLDTGKRYAEGKSLKESELVQLSIDKLGLSNIQPFQAEKRILEYLINL